MSGPKSGKLRVVNYWVLTLSDLCPNEVPKQGIGDNPQGRRLFKELSVAENIEVDLNARGIGKETREMVLDMFPCLRERLNQRAETCSGSTQQMLATARCLEPSVLLLDEPTESLQPSMIALIRETVERLRAQGMTINLVKLRGAADLSIADHGTFIENGHGRETVTDAHMRKDPTRLQSYVGA